MQRLSAKPKITLLSVLNCRTFLCPQQISLSQSELFPAAGLSLILGRCVLIRSELNEANSSFLLRLRGSVHRVLNSNSAPSHNHQLMPVSCIDDEAAELLFPSLCL